MKYKIFDIPESDLETLSIKGNNKKHILVAVNSKDLSENSEFLQKILGAIKLNVAEDCLVLEFSEDSQVSLNQLKETNQIRKVINFGVPHQSLGTQLPFTEHHVFPLEDMTLLTTKPLGEISKSQDLKKRLWNSLKEIFADAR